MLVANRMEDLQLSHRAGKLTIHAADFFAQGRYPGHDAPLMLRSDRKTLSATNGFQWNCSHEKTLWRTKMSATMSSRNKILTLGDIVVHILKNVF